MFLNNNLILMRIRKLLTKKYLMNQLFSKFSHDRQKPSYLIENVKR